MSDRMTILGKDNLPKYVIENNIVTDCKEGICKCGEGSPTLYENEQLTCLICNLPKIKTLED